MEISTTSIKKKIVGILHRYHVMIFVVFVLGGLVVIVLMLNNIITKSGDSTGYTPETMQKFDQKTMDRIEQLKTRDDPPAQLDLSRGRTNPFVE